jgi:hypothetical protein
MELDTVVSGSAGKRRRNDDDRNDRNCKRSAVMRECTAGEGSGSDLGAGGSGNGAGGGEVEYDGREADIGACAGEVSDMGRSGQVGGGGKRGVLMYSLAGGERKWLYHTYLLCLSRRSALSVNLVRNDSPTGRGGGGTWVAKTNTTKLAMDITRSVCAPNGIPGGAGWG